MAVAAPLVTPLLRPLGKTVIKAGISVYDQGRVALAEANERTSDMIAEARAEMAEQERGGNGHDRRRRAGDATGSTDGDNEAAATS
jgi:hypothetical protein